MLFKTTEAHEALRKQVREWAEKEVKPIVLEKDRGPVEEAWMEDQVKQMAAHGWLGVPYSKDYGGEGRKNRCIRFDRTQCRQRRRRHRNRIYR